MYVFVVFYMLADCRKLIAMGRSYWTHFWNWFNWVCVFRPAPKHKLLDASRDLRRSIMQLKLM